MTHPNVERYLKLTEDFKTGDVASMGDFLAPDVVWHEAGAQEPFRGRDAVLDRMAGMGSGTAPEISVRAILGDDDNLVCIGHADFDRTGQHVGYDYVEHMRVKDGLVTERWSYMDSVPADVEAFFAG